MKSKKSEDRDYLKQFEDKSVEELLDILSTEAEKLKNMIKDMFNRSGKNK